MSRQIPRSFACRRTRKPAGYAAAHHVWSPVHEVPARAGALAQRVHNLIERQPLGTSKGHRFGHGFDDAGAHDLVGCLRCLTAAGRAEVRDGLAHGAQDRLRLSKGFWCATRHDGESRFLGAFDAAADGAIQKLHAAWLQEIARRAGRLGPDCGAIDDERSLAASQMPIRVRLAGRRHQQRRR